MTSVEDFSRNFHRNSFENPPINSAVVSHGLILRISIITFGAKKYLEFFLEVVQIIWIFSKYIVKNFSKTSADEFRKFSPRIPPGMLPKCSLRIYSILRRLIQNVCGLQEFIQRYSQRSLRTAETYPAVALCNSLK